MTLTASALGAQTAKYVPSGSCDGMRAQLVEEVAVRALVEEMQVERAEQGARDHEGGVTTSRIPRSGMRTQSGRMFSS